MSLIRCPSCKLDTSDSLVRCPNCGFTLGSSPLLASLQSHTADAIATSSTLAQGAARSGPFSQLASVPRMFWLTAVLVVLAFVPHAFPVLIVLAIAWQMFQRRSAGDKKMQAEAWQAFVRELKGLNKSSSDKPLERLRRIERDLGDKRDA